MKRIAVVLLSWAVLTAPAIALGSDEITQDDLASARRQHRVVAADLEAAAVEYENAVQQAAALERAAVELTEELAVVETNLAAARDSATRIARGLYMTGGANRLQRLFGLTSIAEASVAERYLGFATASDVATLARYRALRQSYLDQEDRLVTASRDQATATEDLQRLAAEILVRLQTADTDYRALVAAYEEQEYRKWLATSTTTTTTLAPTTTTTTVAPGVTTTSGVPTTTTTAVPSTTTTTLAPSPEPPGSGLSCPVDGPTAFSDTWGASRSGGRTHEGVDMIAARGTHVVAIETGTVLRMSSGGLGGVVVWLRGDSGDTYYYAHLDGWASGLAVGDDLVTGDLLGYVGNSGNAQYTVPHLHFEYHPDGGSAINPYPLVKGLCG